MGGEIYSLQLNYQEEKDNKIITTPDLTPEEMELDLIYVNKLLGLELKENDAIKLLEKMGYGYETKTKHVLIPAYRADILHQADLIEDIAIAYGYENFEEIIPKVATIGKESKIEVFFRKIRDLLVGLRLLEVKNYHLCTEEELNQKMLLEEELIPLKNALGEYNHLRNSLFPSLLKNLKENQHHEYPQNIFEIGRTFKLKNNPKDNDDVQDYGTGIKETERLAVVLCHEHADFTEIKQVLDALASALGVECSVKESSHPSGIPGRVGEIIISGIKLGTIGEFHPQVLENWSILVPVVGMQLNLNKLFELIN